MSKSIPSVNPLTGKYQYSDREIMNIRREIDVIRAGRLAEQEKIRSARIQAMLTYQARKESARSEA